MHMGRQFARKIKLSLLGLGLLLCLSALAGADELVGGIEPKLQDEALIQAIHKGGYVLYFRHGPTNKVGEKNVDKKDLNNCGIQRNLSPEGRAQTKAMGVAIKRLQIPVGDVYTSPYCRCVDTAMNLFGKAEKSDALHFAIHTSKFEREDITQKLTKMLATPPAAGMNTAIVSHTANLNSAVKIFPRPEGVAHVFKPKADGKFSYVGVIQPEVWMTAKSPVSVAKSAEEDEQGWFSSIGRWFSNLF